MKYIFKITSFLIIMVILTACQNSNNSRPYIINKKEGVNPNSIAYKTQDKALDRKNNIEIAHIAANSKLEVAKIESIKAIDIAKINSQTQRDVTKQTASTNLEMSKIDSKTREVEQKFTLYIAIGLIASLIIGFILWYLNKKKSLEIQVKLEENRLQHELAIKEKELQEGRIQKVLELAISGQLPPDIQKDVIRSITHKDESTQTKLIESI